MPFAYPFGIEEEYFLVDAVTKAVAREMPAAFLDDVRLASAGQVKGEFLQSQLEAITVPHTSMAEARAELKKLRRTAAEVAARHGLAILAAGTHPTARWLRSQQTVEERYDIVMDDLQMIGHRNMLCGLHVHVELPDADDRIDVMSRMLPYIPLFLALSTSSPFWQTYQTGLKGYRLAAYDELPRTGVPELFRRREDYDAYVEALVRAGVMKDASYIWWAIRPSLQHPTLELRAPDTCTRADDAVAIAALYRAITRALIRDPAFNRDLTPVERAIVVENKWRAQRYGLGGTFVDIAGAGAISVAEMLDQVTARVEEDAAALGCRDDLLHCRKIVAAGTSADIQLAVFEQALAGSKSHGEALRAVTEWIVEATVSG